MLAESLPTPPTVLSVESPGADNITGLKHDTEVTGFIRKNETVGKHSNAIEGRP